MKPVLFTLGAAEGMFEQLCRMCDLEPGEVIRRQFPDGESYLRLASPVAGRDVVLLCSLDRPDPKTLPLLFAAAAARQQGAPKVGLVAPYLSYMRQDRAFAEGEAVTSIAYARLISAAFDWLVTVDPHLHRHPTLDAVYTIPSIAVSAARPIAAWIRSTVPNPILVGPDEESLQWVQSIARLADAPFTVLRKTRRGDYDVSITGSGPEGALGSRPIIIDDIVSSARTMIEAVRVMRAEGKPPPLCIGVHAIFAGNAFELLQEAGPEQIVTCNTVAHSSNAIDVAEELGAAIRLSLARSET